MAASTKKKGSTPEETLDKLLAKRARHAARVNGAQEQYQADLRAAQDRYAERVRKSPKKLEKIDAKLGEFALGNRYRLTRRLTKTIKRAFGILKYTLRAPELEMPGDEKPIIDFLLARRGGEEYLTKTYKVNRRALLQANPDLIRELRRFGVYRGRHTNVTVQSPSDAKAKTVASKRYNERSTKK